MTDSEYTADRYNSFSMLIDNDDYKNGQSIRMLLCQLDAADVFNLLKHVTGKYLFNYNQGYLQVNEKRIKLTARESDLLKIHLVNRNQVLKRKTILDHL